MIALTTCQLLHIDDRTIHTLIDTEAGFAARLLQALSRRIDALDRDIEAYSLRSPLQRLVGFLFNQCGDGATQDVVLPVAKSVIASRLGMTPEAMSRTLRDMMNAGLIEVCGNRIALLDKERLRNLIP